VTGAPDHIDAAVDITTRPVLTLALMGRLRAYGSAETVVAGDFIYQLGDDSYDLILIESGRVDLLCDLSTGQPPSLIAEMGPGWTARSVLARCGRLVWLNTEIHCGGRGCFAHRPSALLHPSTAPRAAVSVVWP
jgi:hypothetical protein